MKYLFPFTLLLASFILSGCGHSTRYVYADYVQGLDDQSEIAFSTYPAWYPDEKNHVPLLYVKLESFKYLKLQFHVREQGQTSGKNPHVESILIRSLSCRLDEEPERVLLTDYRETFWQQPGSGYQNIKKIALPYRAEGILTLRVDLELNGKDYIVEGRMPAQRHASIFPMMIYYAR